ncbi:hypothetical protein M885DRAFT_540710 [Pelagophyceae sp. CCMP2097]|nr:hypothetical protein M885DRAFT_540710 [Pelagophyceae sp. CCMP2097]
MAFKVACAAWARAPVPRPVCAGAARRFGRRATAVWQHVVDPQTGGTYYHNPQTDVTTMVGAALPTWEPVVDPSTKGIYWWDTATDVTTPVGAACPAVDAPLAHYQGGAAAQYQQGSLQQQGGAMMQHQQPQQGGGMMSGLGGMVATGMAFGGGSAIAHQAVGAAAGILRRRASREACRGKAGAARVASSTTRG